MVGQSQVSSRSSLAQLPSKIASLQPYCERRTGAGLAYLQNDPKLGASGRLAVRLSGIFRCCHHDPTLVAQLRASRSRCILFEGGRHQNEGPPQPPEVGGVGAVETTHNPTPDAASAQAATNGSPHPPCFVPGPRLPRAGNKTRHTNRSKKQPT